MTKNTEIKNGGPIAGKISVKGSIGMLQNDQCIDHVRSTMNNVEHTGEKLNQSDHILYNHKKTTPRTCE